MLWTLLLLLPAAAAEAGMGRLTGNDTGGIIAWSPWAQRHAVALAAAHCARYGKHARLTSIRPHPGDYIGFACIVPPGFDPAGPRPLIVLRVRS